MSTSATRTTPRSRRWLGWVAPVAIAGLAGTVAGLARPAQAASPAPPLTNAVCYVDVPVVTLSPGFSATPSAGTGFSGPGSTIRCLGTVRDERVMGDPGPLAVTFTYGSGLLSSLAGGDTCLIGSGDGTVSALVPTADGIPILLTGPIHFGFVGPLSPFYGNFGESTFGGVGEVLPDISRPQDCVTTPFTTFSIRGQVGLKSVDL